jgi:D-amino-acid dehydrogenase
MELTTDGHAVTVFEKAGGIAEGASFASPGWIGLTGLTGWDTVSPTWPKVGPGGLTTSAGWWRRPGARRWLSAMKKHTTPDHQLMLFSTSLDLATLSVERLRRTLSQPGVDVERSQGIMVLIRSEADLAPYTAGLLRLKDRDIKVADIDPAEAKKLEPGLTDDAVPAIRWWLADDEVINGRQWLGSVESRCTAAWLRDSDEYQCDRVESRRQTDVPGCVATAPDTII